MLGLRFTTSAKPVQKTASRTTAPRVSQELVAPNSTSPCGRAETRSRLAMERVRHRDQKYWNSQRGGIQNRRCIETNSRSGPSSSEGCIGSKAMPHLGQAPGPSWTTSGCMGQVYFPALPLLAGIVRSADFLVRYCCGAAWNLAKQCLLQK